MLKILLSDFQCSLRADPDWKEVGRGRPRARGDFQCSLRADPDWKLRAAQSAGGVGTFSALCEPILIGSASPSFASTWSSTFSALCEPILIGSLSDEWRQGVARLFQCSLRADPDWKPGEASLIVDAMNLSVLSASRS